MADYTTFIPREFFYGKSTSIQITIAIVIILVLIFIGYKIHEINDKRRKPE